MDNAQDIVADAIGRSISHDEIVTVDGTPEIHEELLALCDDSADADEVTEYWGTTDDGAEWRVHAKGGV